jgi:hypothetical protein
MTIQSFFPTISCLFTTFAYDHATPECGTVSLRQCVNLNTGKNVIFLEKVTEVKDFFLLHQSLICLDRVPGCRAV